MTHVRLPQEGLPLPVSQSMQVPSRGVPIRIRQAVTGILKLMSIKLFCLRRRSSQPIKIETLEPGRLPGIRFARTLILEFSCGILNANKVPILGEYKNSLCLVVSYDYRNNLCCIRTDQDDQLMTVNANDVAFIRAITADTPIPVDTPIPIDIDQKIDGNGIGFLIGKDSGTGKYKVKINVKINSHEYEEKIIWLEESQFKINTQLPHTKRPSPMTGQQTVRYSCFILSFANRDDMTVQSVNIHSDTGWKMMGLDGPVYLNGSKNTQLREIRDEICVNVKEYKRYLNYFTLPNVSLVQKEFALERIASALKKLGAYPDIVDLQMDKIQIDSGDPPLEEVFTQLKKIYDQLINPKHPSITPQSRGSDQRQLELPG